VDAGSIGVGGSVFVFAYSRSLAGMPTASGELLLDPTSSRLLTDLATVGGAGISFHTIAIPADPFLSGSRVHLQAFLSDAAPSGQLTNAIDLVLGH